MAKFDPSKVVVKKEVTLPVRQLSIEKPAYLKITDNIRLTKSVDEKTGEEKDLPILTCIDLETEKSCHVVVPSVLYGIFQDNYPIPQVDGESTAEDATAPYVGKAFQIIKGRKPSGKRYHTFTVCEIEA
jgi:hypothetical protein